ncbi:MAG TPA: hypothetical protein PLQ11_01380 [Beijerinckiaceae bacterium]|nr:hypothetical protein [Beijerinckiaceae bacterium]
MGWDALSALATMLAGLVFAGGLIEAVAGFTRQRIGFDLVWRSVRLGWLALPFLIMAGPAIVLRETALRRTGPGWNGALFAVGLVVALAWALASGHVLLSIIRASEPLLVTGQVRLLN